MLAGRDEINATTAAIIRCAIAVHRVLGPGLLESAYQACLSYELSAAGHEFEAAKHLLLNYKGLKLDCSYRLDFVVRRLVIVEVKAVAALAPIHTAQVITYLKLTGCPVGLLINFNVAVLKQGIRRILRPRSAPAALE